MRRVWLAVLALGLGACGKRSGGAVDGGALALRADAGADRRPEIVKIEAMAIQAGAWPPEAGDALEDRALAGRVWEGLSQSPNFMPGSTRRAHPGEPARVGGFSPGAGERLSMDAGPGVHVRGARLKIHYAVELGEAEGKSVMRGEVTYTLEWTGAAAGTDADETELSDSFACDGDLASGAVGPDLAAKLVECALMRATEGLVQAEGIHGGDPKAIVAALDGTDPTLRQVAYNAIAARRVTEVVPKLIELLKSDDVLTRDGAIGALVGLREPRAVRPLTELGRFNDLDMMRRVIDAIGAIGGDEARSYLELVASGHDVPVIRELAEKALEGMNRRADGGM